MTRNFTNSEISCHHYNKVLTQMLIKQGSKFNGVVTHHAGLSKNFHQSSPDIKRTILLAIDMTKEEVDKIPHDLTVFIISTRIPGRLSGRKFQLPTIFEITKRRILLRKIIIHKYDTSTKKFRKRNSHTQN